MAQEDKSLGPPSTYEAQSFCMFLVTAMGFAIN